MRLRELLIRELMDMYPYPQEWFEDKPTSALIAMSCRRKKKKKSFINNTANMSSVRKYEDGEYLVRTASGWEVEIR